jgi:anti-anti-sigma factor
MTIDIRQEADRVIVRLAGSVQLLDAEELAAQADALLTGPARHIIFDLSALEFIGSAGLAALLRIHHALKGRDGSVRLVSPRPLIAELLRLTRVSELIPILASLETARQAVASP